MKSTSPKIKAITVGVALAGLACALPQASAAGAAQSSTTAGSTAAGSTAAGNTEFARLDANHDGMLTRAEVKGLRGFATAFNEADENHDGRLSQDEYIKADAIYTRAEAARYVDDTLVTAKVKAALVKELKLESTDVSVKTESGQVLLSGFVDNASQRDKAVQTASKVAGVLTVRNGLVVR